MAYYRRYRSRSREPENVGQNVHVFRPLPSLHQQNRQRKQTGILPQFGFSDTGASSNFQAPPRQRLTTYVMENKATTASPQKRATNILDDDDDDSPPTRERGCPPLNQNVPPHSYARRSADPEYYPPGHYNRRAYSRDNRNAGRNSPIRSGRRSADRLDPTMKRARSREPYNRDHYYANNQRGRSRGSEADVKPSRSTRSSERQPPKAQQRRSAERYSSVEIIDPNQPSTSRNVQRAAPPSRQPLPVIRSLENKEPSIGTMIVRHYAPGPSNQNVVFAPNIFAYPSIRENVNGLNTIGNVIDAVRSYKKQKRRKKL